MINHFRRGKTEEKPPATGSISSFNKSKERLLFMFPWLAHDDQFFKLSCSSLLKSLFLSYSLCSLEFLALLKLCY